MQYYEIEPQTPGSIWNRSELKESPPGEKAEDIIRFVFNFITDDFDDIFTNAPYFFVTKACKDELVKNKISGITFEQIENEFQDTEKSLDVDIYRMDIVGAMGTHEIIKHDNGYSLIVSENVLSILNSLKLNDCPTRPFC